MSEVKILKPGPLWVERLHDGRRKLLRDFSIELCEGEACEIILIPGGFTTDYSSWPRCLPGPNYSRIDIAGIVHDYCFRYATLGLDGHPVTYVGANRYWYRIARAGCDETRVGWLWAWAGRIGLFLGAWPVWRRYRAQDS